VRGHSLSSFFHNDDICFFLKKIFLFEQKICEINQSLIVNSDFRRKEKKNFFFTRFDIYLFFKNYNLFAEGREPTIVFKDQSNASAKADESVPG